LSEKNFCTGCGADVGLYKKIMYTANWLYNDGLERAKVRDLSGAISSLRQCLKLNKNHIEARNLLGLVYFERGEVVAALSEWVISKNIRNSKNIASDYIDMIQNNPGRLEKI
jgi:tetratricopeptide (TPR) repeat protein